MKVTLQRKTVRHDETIKNNSLAVLPQTNRMSQDQQGVDNMFTSFQSLRILIIFLISLMFASPVLAKRIGEIGQDEKGKYGTRYEAKYSNEIGFGPATGTNLNRSDMLYGLILGRDWQVGSHGGVFLEGKGVFGAAVTYIDGIIGRKMYLLDEDVSPFLKAGFGFGMARGPDVETKTGFAGTLGVGVAVFRTSAVHLEVTASYSAIFANNEKGQPGIGLLSLSLFY